MQLNGYQLQFICDECQRQQVGPKEVMQMAKAFHHAYKKQLKVSTRWERSSVEYNLGFITYLGHLVEPVKNATGFRKVPVRFANGNCLDNHYHIENQLRNLLTHGTDLTPEEFYQEFEEIHPFLDGNGRVGAILYNVLVNTLEVPQTPPEFIQR